METESTEVNEKEVAAFRAATIRTKGRYMDCGPLIGKIARNFGRWLAGPPFMLVHDPHYKENDADYEVGFPVKGGQSTSETEVKEIPGGRCLFVLHQGPYERLGETYPKIRGYCSERNLEILLPTREVYVKGPGMIFKGDPKKYVTEIQMFLKSESRTF